MLLGVYSIYDTAVKAYSAPIYARNKGEMLRQWSDAVNDRESKLSRHPSDYILFELGTFDDSNAVYTPLVAPLRLATALDFVKSTAPLKDEVVSGTDT